MAPAGVCVECHSAVIDLTDIVQAAEKRGRDAVLAEVRAWAAGERMDAGVLADRYNNTREHLLEAAWTGVKRGLDVVLAKLAELEAQQ